MLNQDGKICKLCQAKFYTLEYYRKFETEVGEVDKINEALCSELFRVQQDGINLEQKLLAINGASDNLHKRK